MIPMLPVEESQKRAREIGITPYVAELNVSRVLLHNPTLAHALDNLLQTLMTKNQVPVASARTDYFAHGVADGIGIRIHAPRYPLSAA